MATLYLHIGTQKTGSTSIQSVLGTHKRYLRTIGYHVHTQGIRGRQATLNRLAMTVLRNDLRTKARQLHKGGRRDASAWARALARLNIMRQFRTSGCDTAIMSSEMFCYARTEDERKCFQTLFAGFDVRPVVVFRKDADWRASWRNQLTHGVWAKNPRLDPTQLLEDWYFDKDAIREFWSDFGPLTEIDYDAALETSGSVVPSILGAFGITDIPPDLDDWLNARK